MDYGMDLILYTRDKRSFNNYRICVWEALNDMGNSMICDDQICTKQACYHNLLIITHFCISYIYILWYHACHQQHVSFSCFLSGNVLCCNIYMLSLCKISQFMTSFALDSTELIGSEKDPTSDLDFINIVWWLVRNSPLSWSTSRHPDICFPEPPHLSEEWLGNHSQA